MKKQDMKVGMHVAVGRDSRSRYEGAPHKHTEAYILVLPTGTVQHYYRSSSTGGKVGLAYRNTHTGAWEPRWVPSAKISHADWDAYCVEWEAAEKARDRRELEERTREDQHRARQESAVTRLEALGVTGLKYRNTLDLYEVEALLSLLDEARGTAETMRRERGEDFPFAWEIDTSDEHDIRAIEEEQPHTNGATTP